MGESAALRRSANGPALPAKPKCIVVVGPSCAGKTTLVDSIRQARIPKVFVATRYVTRPRRQNDSDQENLHLCPSDFDQRKDAGEIAWSWTREMQGDKVTRYGFDKAPSGELAVYSANNALYRNSQSIHPASLVKNAIWIGATAPIEIRRQRMQERSADLSEPEREFRLADLGSDMASHVHLLAHGYGETAEEAKSKFSELVAELSIGLQP